MVKETAVYISRVQPGGLPNKAEILEHGAKIGGNYSVPMDRTKMLHIACDKGFLGKHTKLGIWGNENIISGVKTRGGLGCLYPRSFGRWRFER